MKQLNRVVAMAVVALVVLVGCSGDSQEADPPEESVPTDVIEETPGAEEPVSTAGLHRFVQDLWVYERIVTVDAEGTTVDLTDAVIEGLAIPADRRVELTDGVTFHVHDSLAAAVTDAAGTVRDDLEVVAGLIEHDGELALSVLATPTPDAAAPVRFGDQVTLDLTYLGARLQPGDPLLADHAFLQAHPDGDDGSHGELSGLELLAARMAVEQVGWFGEVVDGEPEVLVYAAQAGHAVEGSTHGYLPAKANDMTDGMSKGLRRCDGGPRCVSRFFRKFGDGAKSSYQQAWDNGGGSPQAPRHPTCRGGSCARSWGDPHLTTFDGIAYDMQAIGEFIAMTSPELEVQLRTRPFRDLTTISIGTAVAVGVDGHRVTVDIEADLDERIRIDGDPVPIDDLRNDVRQVGDATVSVAGDALQIERNDDLVTIVNLEGREFIDLYLDLAAEEIDTRGLLGTANGDRSDDYTTRTGDVLELHPDHQQLYGEFVESWRISQGESLFDYAPGTDTDFYTDRLFPRSAVTVADLDDDVRRRAEAVCRAAGIEEDGVLESCVLDYALTGDIAFVRSATTAEVDQLIVDGVLDPDAMPIGGDGAGGAGGVRAELTVAPYEPGPEEIVWLFTEDGEAEQVPPGVAVTPIEASANLRVFEFTDQYGYPTDPILRVSPPAMATDPEEAVERESFVEFTVTPTAGPVEITRVQLAVGRGPAGETRRGIELRSSADGYATSLLTTDIWVARPDMERFAAPVPGVPLAGPTTFRLYIYTPGSGNTVEIGDLALTIRR